MASFQGFPIFSCTTPSSQGQVPTSTWLCLLHWILEVPEQALDGIPLGLGLVVEIKPSEFSCTVANHYASKFKCLILLISVDCYNEIWTLIRLETYRNTNVAPTKKGTPIQWFSCWEVGGKQDEGECPLSHKFYSGGSVHLEAGQNYYSHPTSNKINVTCSEKRDHSGQKWTKVHASKSQLLGFHTLFPLLCTLDYSVSPV